MEGRNEGSKEIRTEKRKKKRPRWVCKAFPFCMIMSDTPEDKWSWSSTVKTAAAVFPL